MSDIFREVDEALQQEKLVKIWKEYGPTLIAAAILLVLSTAATTAWVSWNSSRNASETARLVEAMEKTTPDTATALQDVAKDTRGNHAALALLSAAGLHADKQEFDQAAALYQQAYEESGAPRELRDLARLLFVRSTLAAAKDTASADLLKVLAPVLDNEKSPWQWPAKIDAALISAHLDNDYAAAAAHLDGIKDAVGVPPSLAERAQSLLQLYTSLASANKDMPKKDPQG